MCNLLVQVFRRILMAHLTRYQSRRLMSSTYFMVISHHTLSWWVRWLSICVLASPMPNMKLLVRCRTRHRAHLIECPRRKHRPTQDMCLLAVKSDQETHIARISLGECFVGVDVFFYYFRDCSLYFILFKRLYFIFFIYGLKLNFYFLYLWFEIEFFLFKVLKKLSNNKIYFF
jgi:hypothetical protein